MGRVAVGLVYDPDIEAMLGVTIQVNEYRDGNYCIVVDVTDLVRGDWIEWYKGGDTVEVINVVGSFYEIERVCVEGRCRDGADSLINEFLDHAEYLLKKGKILIWEEKDVESEPAFLI